MKDAYTQLASLIKRHAGAKPVYYIPAPGNWGDALIREGTLKFFKDIGLNYQERQRVRRVLDMPPGMVVYGGSGAWCELWDNSSDVAELAGKFNVLVLPSTYQCKYDMSNVTFVRRDKFESAVAMPNALFCHDMAFYLDHLKGTKGKGIGFFFRRDRESAQRLTIPACNNDLNAKGCHTTCPGAFVAAVDEFSIVHTDRLHVAIAACLLGKELHLYPGSYFKNRAVFNSSMKGRFPNVHFHEDFKIGGAK